MAPVIKIQATLRGYSAWVVEQLMIMKGEGLSDITKYLFDRWVDDNSEYLQRFDLNRENYRATEDGRGKVIEYKNDTA